MSFLITVSLELLYCENVLSPPQKMKIESKQTINKVYTVHVYSVAYTHTKQILIKLEMVVLWWMVENELIRNNAKLQ